MEVVSQSTQSKRARLASAMYSSAETAALCGISYTTLNEQIHAKTFPVTPVKIGRVYKFPKSQVNKLLGIASDAAAEPQADNAA